MANITVRTDPEVSILPLILPLMFPSLMPSPMISLDPYRTMRDLLSADPFRDFQTFDPFGFQQAITLPRVVPFAPDFEVRETKEAYQFHADLPGVDIGDIDISLSGNRVTISGKREVESSDSGDTWYTSERSYGAFSRAFSMPNGADLDHAHAELTGGVLTLVVPKITETETKNIPVTSKK